VHFVFSHSAGRYSLVAPPILLGQVQRLIFTEETTGQFFPALTGSKSNREVSQPETLVGKWLISNSSVADVGGGSKKRTLGLGEQHMNCTVH
jgi:hypothetical protein